MMNNQELKNALLPLIALINKYGFGANTPQTDTEVYESPDSKEKGVLQSCIACLKNDIRLDREKVSRLEFDAERLKLCITRNGSRLSQLQEKLFALEHSNAN